MQLAAVTRGSCLSSLTLASLWRAFGCELTDALAVLPSVVAGRSGCGHCLRYSDWGWILHLAAGWAGVLLENTATCSLQGVRVWCPALRWHL